MTRRPLITIQLTCNDQTHLITAMVDTGADVTIISQTRWPKSWPLSLALDAVQGVGGGMNPLRSSVPISITFPEGQKSTVCPYVMSLPGNLEGLVGRDVMSQLGAILHLPQPTLFLTGATAKRPPTPKISWKTEEPVWVEQ